MSLAHPGWLAFLPLVLVLAGIVAAGAAWHRRRLRAVFGDMLAEIVPRSVRVRRTLRDLAALLGLALAIVALAEPRFDKRIRTVETTGTDLVLLLDLSRSMDARDVDPSRLERARREILDLTRLAVGDRVGLITFAGGAYPRLPLTQDFGAVALVVTETSTDSFQSQGSDLGGAIEKGMALLERSQDQAGQALLVLSDGEIHDADRALAAADEANDAGIPIYGMGIGLEGSEIPLPDGRVLEYQGQTAITTPDFEVLEEVARRTGGAFVKSNASDRDMQGLYSEIRRAVRAVERGGMQRETWRTAYHWPLSIAVVLLLFAAWIGDGRRRWGAALAVILSLSLAPVQTARAADPLLDADRAFRSGEHAKAVDQLTELSLEHPDDPEIFDRLGAARYRAGDWEGAARAFDQAARLEEAPADALYNSGNAHYQAGRLEQAKERYDDVLAIDPEHPSAARNRDIISQEIEARRLIQPPPPPPPQPGEGEPQDGSGSEGEPNPSEGSPGEPSEPQAGEPQEGEPQDGESGEASEPQGGEPQGGPPPEGESGPNEEDPQDGSADAVAPEDVDPQDGEDGDPSQAAGNGTMGEDVGPITEGQAHRLLDAIEEGSRRETVTGRPEGKPW